MEKRHKFIIGAVATVIIVTVAAIAVWALKPHDSVSSKPAVITNTNSETGDADAETGANSNSTLGVDKQQAQASTQTPDVGQPEMNLADANDKIQECINSAVNLTNTDQITKLMIRCFYSTSTNIERVYGMRSIGEISDKTNTEWMPGKDLATAKKEANTSTHVYVGDTHVGDVNCYWDVARMNCNPQLIQYTQYGFDMKNSTAEQNASALKPY